MHPTVNTQRVLDATHNSSVFIYVFCFSISPSPSLSQDLHPGDLIQVSISPSPEHDAPPSEDPNASMARYSEEAHETTVVVHASSLDVNLVELLAELTLLDPDIKMTVSVPW